MFRAYVNWIELNWPTGKRAGRPTTSREQARKSTDIERHKIIGFLSESLCEREINQTNYQLLVMAFALAFVMLCYGSDKLVYLIIHVAVFRA